MGKKTKKRKDANAAAYKRMQKRRDGATDAQVVEEICALAADILSGYEHEVVDKTGADITDAYYQMLVDEMNRRDLTDAVGRRMREIAQELVAMTYLSVAKIEGVQA